MSVASYYSSSFVLDPFVKMIKIEIFLLEKVIIIFLQLDCITIFYNLFYYWFRISEYIWMTFARFCSFKLQSFLQLFGVVDSQLRHVLAEGRIGGKQAMIFHLRYTRYIDSSLQYIIWKTEREVNFIFNGHNLNEYLLSQFNRLKGVDVTIWISNGKGVQMVNYFEERSIHFQTVP